MTPSNIHDVAKTAIQAEHKAQRTGTPVAREESEPEPAPKEKGGFLQKAADKVRKGFSAVFADDDEDEAGDDEEASGLKALEVAQAGLAKAAERARERRASMPSAEEVEARNPLV
jgi:hypothetical protein